MDDPALCEPSLGQNALDYGILHVQSRFSGEIPRTPQKGSRCLDPGTNIFLARKTTGKVTMTTESSKNGAITLTRIYFSEYVGINVHKRQKIRLYLLIYVIILFLSNISCLQLCQMFYRGQFCESDFQNLDHKQCRPPKFPIRFTPLPVIGSSSSVLQ